MQLTHGQSFDYRQIWRYCICSSSRQLFPNQDLVNLIYNATLAIISAIKNLLRLLAIFCVYIRLQLAI